MKLKKLLSIGIPLLTTVFFTGCGQGGNNGGNKGGSGGAISKEEAAQEVYVPPGEKDDYYAFMSGGYSGNLTVYGLPSGRMLKEIPVFSQFPTSGYGYTEETKPLLHTTDGFIPWDDMHHTQLSRKDGKYDGKYVFCNGHNTPRIARVSLSTFETTEILEIPNIAGNHASPFITPNSKYLLSATRFSRPVPQEDVPISSYEENFEGLINFVKAGDSTGGMEMGFQIRTPGYMYDLGIAGKGKSRGWAFFTTYNTEEAHTLLEKNASQRDKDYIAAVNWKKAEEYIEKGNYSTISSEYYHNVYDEHKHKADSNLIKKDVKVLDPQECPGLIYYLPTPKSPHGVDVNPSGEYIVGSGKLSQNLTVHSFENMKKAIENEQYAKKVNGIPVLDFEKVLGGTVKQPGLGPLHTQFDDKGYAYTSFFISSEIVKWKVETQKVVDRAKTYYSIGHLLVPGGGSENPYGEYAVALNKITKDRYLPTGPELEHAAQLYDISGDQISILSDFPTHGEPHYAQAMPAKKIMERSKKTFDLQKNEHPYATKQEKNARVERDGKDVHVYMTMIRSHLTPDNIEGIKVGDDVYFHLTNLEQSWDVPHGFAIKGANNAELLVMPGQTETFKWEVRKNDKGIVPFYCTDFCSALHQEMQGYVRVSPTNSDVELSWRMGDMSGGGFDDGTASKSSSGDQVGAKLQ